MSLIRAIFINLETLCPFGKKELKFVYCVFNKIIQGKFINRKKKMEE